MSVSKRVVMISATVVVVAAVAIGIGVARRGDDHVRRPGRGDRPGGERAAGDREGRGWDRPFPTVDGRPPMAPADWEPGDPPTEEMMEARHEMREQMRQGMEQARARFLSLSDGPQRDAWMDWFVAAMVESGVGPGMGRGPGGDGGRGRGDGARDPAVMAQRMKSRLENADPVERAERTEFRKEMREAMERRDG